MIDHSLRRTLPVSLGQPRQAAGHAAALSSASFVQRAAFNALLVFTYLLYSRVLELLMPSARLPLLFGAAAVYGAAVSGSLTHAFRDRAARYFLLFSIWFALATAAGVWRAASIDVFKDSWSKALLVFCSIIALVNSDQDLRRFLYAVCFGTGTAAVLAITKGITTEGRLCLPVGELSNPNQLGFYMLFGILFCTFPIAHARYRLEKIGFSTLSLMMVWVVLRTGSRGCLSALVCVLVLYFFRAPLFRKLQLTILCVFVPLILSFVVPRHISDRWMTLLYGDSASNIFVTDQMSALESTRSRVELLKGSLIITLAHPLLGVGPGNFITANSERVFLETGTGHWQYSHNTYTQVSSEMGLPGLFFYLAAFGCGFMRCWRISKLDPGLGRSVTVQAGRTMVLVLVATSFCMTFGLTAYDFHIPLFVALAVTVHRLAASRLCISAANSNDTRVPPWGHGSAVGAISPWTHPLVKQRSRKHSIA